MKPIPADMMAANGTPEKDTPMTVNGTSAGHSMRIDWVDYAKGICIVMVVMMHSVFRASRPPAGPDRVHAWAGGVRKNRSGCRTFF